MNAGKSTSLLQSNHNYEVRDLKTCLFTPQVDAEHHNGQIHSRIGLSKEAHVFQEDFNFCDYFDNKTNENVSCILVDEAQFLTKEQVKQLCNFAIVITFQLCVMALELTFKAIYLQVVPLYWPMLTL